MRIIKLLGFSALLGALIVFVSCSMQNQTNSNNYMGMNHNGGNMPMNNQGMNHGQMDNTMMRSSPNAADAPYDLQFNDTMTMHHQGAIDMAKAIEGRAQHPELNTLAKNIVADQEKEIAQMKKWRDDWFKDKAPALNMSMAGMNDSMKGMSMKNLSSLSGSDLDLEFINEMIPHHQGAVAMANEALQKSQKDEIKTLTNGIIKAQNAEIKQMQAWQTAWKK
ncbi:MAG: DUF305 domain-containing protein [Acidobacteriota bacterium]